jgi:hypothetical protein
MAAMIWERASGRQDVRPYTKKTGAAIVVGELLALDDDTYNVFAAATDKLVFGIAMEAAASSSTAMIKVDRISPEDEITVKVATGTAAATEIGAFADIGSSTTGITLTESNNDCVIVGFPKAGYQTVRFGANCLYPTPTTVVSD